MLLTFAQQQPGSRRRDWTWPTWTRCHRHVPDRAGVHRGNSAATRNTRLTAIHSLFRYASLQAPEHAALIRRVLAIPAKRTRTDMVSFLTQAEVDALIGAVDTTTWHGRRDQTLLRLAAQTGLRVSELTGLTIADVHLGTGPHVSCRGKNRRSRCTPLTPPTVTTLASWLSERGGSPDDPLFPTRTGNPLSRERSPTCWLSMSRRQHPAARAWTARR